MRSAIFSLLAFLLPLFSLASSAWSQAEGQKNTAKPSVGILLQTQFQTRDPAWNSSVREAAAQIFTERLYNVIDISSGTEKLSAFEKRVATSQNIPIDKDYRASMMMDIDIVLEISAWNKSIGDHVKGMATLKAYETTTRRLIGSASTTGTPYLLKANQAEFQTIKEAVQAAAERVISQIQQHWMRDLQQGHSYCLIVAGNLAASPDLDDKISLQLKQIQGVKELRRVNNTKNRLIFHFRNPSDSLSVSREIKRLIGKTPGVRSLKIPISTRKFFLVIVNH